MKSLIKRIFLLTICFSALGIFTLAQDGNINFDSLKGLEKIARDVVEVNIDGKMLELAKRAIGKDNDKDSKKLQIAISGLKGIYVRVYNFDGENQYNPADINAVRDQFKTPDWQRIVNVRSKVKNEQIDVFMKLDGEKVSGVTVLVSDTKSLAFVNLVGPIDLDGLSDLGGNLGIPKMEVEKSKTAKPKETQE